MDKWEDYPIKVLDMALLIVVTLLMVSSLFSTCGCFLRVERSFSKDLHQLRVEGPLGAIKGGPNRPRSGPGRPAWAHRPRPIPAQFGRPFAPLGPYVFTLPPPFALFWRCHPHIQDGGSPCKKFGLLRFNPRGCSFVTLRSLPPLEVISSSSWTRTRLLDFSF
jgi:hypothetical protein